MIATPAAAAVAIALALPAASGPEAGRFIVVEATVEASPAEVFRLWTTEEGAKRFFAPDARIDAHEGGRYEIIFDPASDPEGARAGTRGAKILRFEPDRRLDFQWSVGVPDVTWDLKATDFETHVEVSLEPVAGDAGKTRVRLVHAGFRRGGSWEAAYDFFARSWQLVLERLAAYCRDGRRPR